MRIKVLPSRNNSAPEDESVTVLCSSRFFVFIETTGKTSSDTVSSETRGELWLTCKVVMNFGVNNLMREDSEYSNRDERSKVRDTFEPSSHSIDNFESHINWMQ